MWNLNTSAARNLNSIQPLIGGNLDFLPINDNARHDESIAE